MNPSKDNEQTDPDTAGGDGTDELSRRKLVATGAAAWASVSVAGCSYITDPGPQTSEDEPTVTNETTSTGGTNGTTNGTDDSGGDSGGGSSGDDCSSIGRFKPGMEVGLHVGIFDPETGDPLGSEAIDTVTVEFPNADYGPLELNWEGPHEAFDRSTWGSKIVTDEETESGEYEYVVHIEGNEETDIETTVTNQFTIV